MRDISPQSPEARRKRLASMRAAFGTEVEEKLKPRLTAWEVVKRVAIGVYNDGFIHAGNLAYLSIVALFPFFIVAAAVAHLLGQGQDAMLTVTNVLRRLPPDVAATLREPVLEVLTVRTGNLLWLGAIVGLWTVAGFIETLRGILRQAYGVRSRTPFWRYRLGAIGLIIASVILTMAAFSFQVALTAAEAFIARVLPFASDAARLVSLTKIAPAIALFVALYMLFYSLTPSRYRKSKCPKWPGAAFTAIWWMGTTELLPLALDSFANYDRTYGSLGGVMVALIFFFLVGLGVVIGAELNAALAEQPRTSLQEPPQGDAPEES